MNVNTVSLQQSLDLYFQILDNKIMLSFFDQDVRFVKMSVDWSKVDQPELVLQRFASRRSVVYGTKGVSAVKFHTLKFTSQVSLHVHKV